MITRQYDERMMGRHLGNLAILSFFLVLIASIILFLWSLYMMTSQGINQPERVEGWAAILRNLPAFSLVILPLAAGLGLSVRSAQLGFRRGLVAIWILSLEAFLVLVEVVGGSLESVGMQSLSTRMVPAFAAVAILILITSVWLARKGSPTWKTTNQALRRRSGALERLALASVLTGIIGGFAWLSIAQIALTAHASAFARTKVPGSLTVKIKQPGSRYIYAEGANVYLGYPSLDELAITVTGPAGKLAPLTTITAKPVYLSEGKTGRIVGSFQAKSAGDFKVVSEAYQPPLSAPYAPSNAYGGIAVGDNVENSMMTSELGVAVLLILTSGAAVLLLLTAAKNNRRSLPPKEV